MTGSGEYITVPKVQMLQLAVGDFNLGMVIYLCAYRVSEA